VGVERQTEHLATSSKESADGIAGSVEVAILRSIIEGRLTRGMAGCEWHVPVQPTSMAWLVEGRSATGWKCRSVQTECSAMRTVRPRRRGIVSGMENLAIATVIWSVVFRAAAYSGVT
jgi:hypothetical protein